MCNRVAFAIAAAAMAQMTQSFKDAGGCSLCPDSDKCDHMMGQYTLPEDLLMEQGPEFRARLRGESWDPAWTAEVRRQRRSYTGIRAKRLHQPQRHDLAQP
jgi:hypothetical protein